MRLVSVDSLVPENKLAVPIYTSSGSILLNAGVILTDKYINKLKSMRLYTVYIDDDRFDDIELTEPLDIRTKNNAAQVIKATYESLHAEKGIDEFRVKDVAKDIIEFVRDSKEKGASILSTDAIDEYIIEHSINVAILTAFIGNCMNYNSDQLYDLVTGAVIHDFGRDNCAEENTEHVQKGFDFMRKCRGINLHSSIVCYEHHENFDGSGYPRKLKGSAISEYSRVIRVADLYSNILHGYEISDKPVMPHQAYEAILALSGSIVDPDIVEIFRDAIVFYPNGCTVLLSNGLKGIVVRQNVGSPQRPVVRTYNIAGVIGEVDLNKRLTLFIKDVLVV
ncbi:MAG TPA: HD domain-containing phosphohydrolase [Clostridia bacterium]|nr:HD domain-containing phosphohydrolase [Clostridia bacterium]